MPHAVRGEILKVDREGARGVATEADQAEADQAEAATVDGGIAAAVEGIIENTQKVAHTKMYRY